MLLSSRHLHLVQDACVVREIFLSLCQYCTCSSSSYVVAKISLSYNLFTLCIISFFSPIQQYIRNFVYLMRRCINERCTFYFWHVSCFAHARYYFEPYVKVTEIAYYSCMHVINCYRILREYIFSVIWKFLNMFYTFIVNCTKNSLLLFNAFLIVNIYQLIRME